MAHNSRQDGVNDGGIYLRYNTGEPMVNEKGDGIEIEILPQHHTTSCGRSHPPQPKETN
ncbi:hypothetical protein [Thalassoroseus pseudoceratinae]|uniref:hypothetical protein n=1 Tax=Thalassoroseus pseudoceratinae TaxID=2713176 RepID=UPI00141DD09D|nr:hypothetical protein [Thalassoroseus pseudoceratinae]